MLRAKAGRAATRALFRLDPGRSFSSLLRFLHCALLALGCGWASPAPKRIISLSPTVTEMLYGIGAFDQLVGVSDYSTYPPQVTKLPAVGGWHSPNLEKITSLRPDLVILDDGQAQFVQDRFTKLNFRVLVVPDRRIDDVYDAITLLGRATEHEEGAARLIAGTRAGLERVSRRTAPLAKSTVVLIVDRTPGTLRNLSVATERSFFGTLVAMAGGRLIAPPLPREYGPLSKEALLVMNPDVIFDFVHGDAKRSAASEHEAWRELSDVKAVQTGRIYPLREDFLPHASQRIVQTAELFARLLHPEAPENSQ